MTIGIIPPIVKKEGFDHWIDSQQSTPKEETPSNPEGLDFKKMLDEEVKTLSTIRGTPLPHERR